MVLCFLFRYTFHFAYTCFFDSVMCCIVLCFMAYCKGANISPPDTSCLVMLLSIIDFYLSISVYRVPFIVILLSIVYYRFSVIHCFCMVIRYLALILFFQGFFDPFFNQIFLIFQGYSLLCNVAEPFIAWDEFLPLKDKKGIFRL